MKKRIHDIVKVTPTAENLWVSDHKIPWNEPAFSARILKEHLSQAHHLASRKFEIIKAQNSWINARYLSERPASILDLGCGPGLYAEKLSGDIHLYHGIDFSPASIEYAREQHRGNRRCSFHLGNVLRADFGGPHDLLTMLYGELNVFSPEDCRHILAKACRAMAPGGTLLVEFQAPEAVQAVGELANSWTRAEQGGLFSDDSYVCLTENHWFSREAVALQCFHVMLGSGEVATYRSTTKAWSREEVRGLFAEAGFDKVMDHEDWPQQEESLMLFSAVKR